jgi:hypothetical protein
LAGCCGCGDELSGSGATELVSNNIGDDDYNDINEINNNNNNYNF